MSEKHESENCVICLSDTPSYHFIPCNHKCVCEDCAKKYVSSDDDNFQRCPVCRREFESITSDIPESITETDDLTVQEEEDLRRAFELNQIEIDKKKSLDMAEALKEEEMLQIAYALSRKEVNHKAQGCSSQTETEKAYITAVFKQKRNATNGRLIEETKEEMYRGLFSRDDYQEEENTVSNYHDSSSSDSNCFFCHFVDLTRMCRKRS